MTSQTRNNCNKKCKGCENLPKCAEDWENEWLDNTYGKEHMDAVRKARI